MVACSPTHLGVHEVQRVHSRRRGLLHNMDTPEAASIGCMEQASGRACSAVPIGRPACRPAPGVVDEGKRKEVHAAPAVLSLPRGAAIHRPQNRASVPHSEGMVLARCMNRVKRDGVRQ